MSRYHPLHRGLATAASAGTVPGGTLGCTGPDPPGSGRRAGLGRLRQDDAAGVEAAPGFTGSSGVAFGPGSGAFTGRPVSGKAPWAYFFPFIATGELYTTVGRSRNARLEEVQRRMEPGLPFGPPVGEVADHEPRQPDDQLTHD